jgi:hypothetical protein
MHSGAPAGTPALVAGNARWVAIVALVLLASYLAEFLTGSTFVPDAILHPLGFAQLAGLYGGGALAIREITVRWDKRWASILLLGALFAILEEGLGARTLVDPTGSREGTLALYSYWLGINWSTFVGITLFHAVFSIAFPILLVELIFPETRGLRLTGNVGLGLAILALGLAATTMALAEPFVPTWPVVAFFAALSVAYVVGAYLVPRNLFSSPSDRPNCPEWVFLGIGGAFVAEVYLIVIGPDLLTAIGVVAFFGGSAALFLYLILRFTGRVDTEIRKVDFALGMVAFLVPIDTIEELHGDAGVLIFTAFTVGLLLYLRRKWTARLTSADPPASGPPGGVLSSAP